MTKVALLKLLVLGIVTFLICLPEFFTTYKVGKVKLSCLTCGHCEQERGEDGKHGWKHGWKSDLNDTTHGENWQQVCIQKFSHRGTQRAGNLPHWRMFMCKTYGVMDEGQISILSSVPLEVMVELQLRDKEFLNLTLYGRKNKSLLQLHSLDEEEEQDEDHGAFYCCMLSVRADNETCLLWMSNQSLLTAEREAKLEHRDGWHYVFRVLWLVLLSMVLLSIASVLLGRISKSRHRRKKGSNNSNQTPKAQAETHTRDAHRLRSELYPIQEVETPDDIEILLDGKDKCYRTTHLHQHSHSSSSTFSDTEEQSC